MGSESTRRSIDPTDHLLATLQVRQRGPALLSLKQLRKLPSFWVMQKFFHVVQVVSCQNYGCQLWEKKHGIDVIWCAVAALKQFGIFCLWTGRDIQLKDMSGERKLVEPVLETNRWEIPRTYQHLQIPTIPETTSPQSKPSRDFLLNAKFGRSVQHSSNMCKLPDTVHGQGSTNTTPWVTWYKSPIAAPASVVSVAAPAVVLLQLDDLPGGKLLNFLGGYVIWVIWVDNLNFFLRHDGFFSTSQGTQNSGSLNESGLLGLQTF